MSSSSPSLQPDIFALALQELFGEGRRYLASQASILDLHAAVAQCEALAPNDAAPSTTDLLHDWRLMVNRRWNEWGRKPSPCSEAEFVAWLRGQLPDDEFSVLKHLTERVQDPAEYLKTVRGKALKQEFRKLVAAMAEGDELWEWEWFGRIGPRNSYSMGWCVVREGALVESHCHSYS